MEMTQFWPKTCWEFKTKNNGSNRSDSTKKKMDLSASLQEMLLVVAVDRKSDLESTI